MATLVAPVPVKRRSPLWVRPYFWFILPALVVYAILFL